MCGRYSFFTDAPSREVLELLDQLRKDPRYDEMKTGEVYPTNLAPVLVAEEDHLVPRLYAWGYPSFHGKGVVINARQETIWEKPLFRTSMETGRCVIPSTGFYEWDPAKRRYLFTDPGETLLYMAGIHQRFGGEERFVILTTDAAGTVADIHDRMPVVLRREDLLDWIRDSRGADALLHSPPPLLARQAS